LKKTHKFDIKSKIVIAILIIIFFIIWQLLSDNKIINPLFFSSPLAVWKDLVEMFSTGYILPHIGWTLFEAFAGLFIGIVLGCIVAFIVGNNKLLMSICEPIFVGINGLPLLALGPLFIVWFGIGLEPKIVLATITVFFLVFFNITAGLKSVDVQLINTLKLMRATKMQILVKVYLPTCIPWLLASLKGGVGAAVLGAIVGEYLGATTGLGWLIQMAGGWYNITRVIACIFVLLIIMFILNYIVKCIDKAVMKWRPTVD